MKSCVTSRSPLGLRGLKSFRLVPFFILSLSQPSWAAWIEILLRLKLCSLRLSQPSWAAWIEIKILAAYRLVIGGRSPLGLRGLKFALTFARPVIASRSPLGLRGLK